VSSGIRSNHVWLVLAYTVVVLLVDALAANQVSAGIDWGIFSWRASGALAQFDYFKFVFWLLVPITWCVLTHRYAVRQESAAESSLRFDPKYFSFAPCKRGDYILLAILVVGGMLSVLAILYVPALREYYPSASGMTAQEKFRLLQVQLLWNVSWLFGWEFLHRYFLLRPVAERWPKFGWVLVPIFEAIYHLQKHPLEMAGMFAVGVLFTWWAVQRRNILLPLIVHASVEIGLMAFLVLV